MREINFIPLSGLLHLARDKFSTMTEKPVLPIGLDAVDDITRGYRSGKVTVIGARTSEGKTAFAIHSAIKLSDKGVSVLYISLEDDTVTIRDRDTTKQQRIRVENLKNFLEDKFF